MANGEDPAMEAVEKPTPDSGRPSLLVHAQSFELSQGDHPVLAAGNPGDEDVRT
jgi:hypothetical protein